MGNVEVSNWTKGQLEARRRTDVAMDTEARRVTERKPKPRQRRRKS